MSINIGDKPEFNVVNVGEELSQNQINALNASAINGSPTATNPYLTRTNTFNTIDTAVRITQDGTGDAFRVEDVASDTTPFVITADGRVGIGTTTVSTNSLTVSGATSILGATSISTSGATPLTVSVTNTASGVTGAIIDYRGTGDAVRITNTGTGNSFVVEDDTNPDNTFFVINADGRVGINGPFSNSYFLNVNGNARTAGLHRIESSTGSGGLWVSTTSALGPTAIFENSTSTTADCVRITNTGTGNSFVVEDAANPDNSPFIIDSIGNVGIGTSSPASKLNVEGGGFRLNGSSSIAAIAEITQTGVASVATFVNTATATADAVRITNLGTGHSFVVEDSASTDTTPFIITNDGRVSIGRASGATAGYQLDVAGSLLCAASTVSLNVTGGNVLVNASGTGDALRITHTGTGNAFVVNDENPDTTSFVIDNAGNVTLGNYLTLHAGAYSASTALVIDNTNYPHELEFKVGTTTYRVPARAI